MSSGGEEERMRNRFTVVSCTHGSGQYLNYIYNPITKKEKERRGEFDLRKENKCSFLFIFWMISLKCVLKVWLGRFWYPE